MAVDAFINRTGIARYQAALITELGPRTNLHALVMEKLFARHPGSALPTPLQRVTLHRHARPSTLIRNSLRIAEYTLTNPDLLSWDIGTIPQLVAGRIFPAVYIDRSAFDLFHGTANFLPRTRRRLARVVTIHDTIPLTHPHGLPKILLRAFVQAPELRPEDHVIVDSETGREELARAIDHPTDGVHVIPIAIDHAMFRPAAETVDRDTHERPPYILSVGTIAHHKNLVRALRAFERLAAAHPALRWKIAGLQGWGWREFQGALDRSPARARVDVLGVVPDRDLSSYYQGARALLFPSLVEGFGIPVAEALACGTPVAASNIPAVREVAGDAFVPFDPLAVESITDATERAAYDPDGREHRRKAGIERVSRLTWPRAADRHLEVYARALDVEVASLLTRKV